MEKVRLLIVEDEAIIAMELQNTLKNLGYQVTSLVNNGKRAIERAETEKPDIVLIDIRINGELDGIETAEIIRNKFGIPVVFSTAYLDEERIERAKITMPFGYILKPIQERDLKVTLEMALYVAKVDKLRRKAELASLENERQFQNLFNSMLDAFALHEMIFDSAGQPTDYRFLKVNKAFEQLTGLTSAAIIGRTVLEVMPKTEPIWIETYGKVVTTGNPIRFEHFALELNKTYEVNAYRFQAGQFVTVFRDVTSKALAEKKVRENEKLLRSIAENYPNSFLSIIEKDFTIGFTSGQEFKKRNLDPNQYIGLRLDQIFGEQTAFVRERYEKAFQGETCSFELHFMNQLQFYRTIPLIEEDGSIPRILAVVENVTERKLTEADHKRANG